MRVAQESFFKPRFARKQSFSRGDLLCRIVGLPDGR